MSYMSRYVDSTCQLRGQLEGFTRAGLLKSDLALGSPDRWDH